jgi:hypothetical protein
VNSFFGYVSVQLVPSISNFKVRLFKSPFENAYPEIMIMIRIHMRKRQQIAGSVHFLAVILIPGTPSSLL